MMTRSIRFIQWDERERCGLLFQDERMWKTPLLQQENHNPLLFFTYPKLQRKDTVFFFENRFLIENYSLSFSWNDPNTWDSLSFWIAITPKGEKYFTQILAPRFYERYKDLKIQIKENGEIVWSGEINPA